MKILNWDVTIRPADGPKLVEVDQMLMDRLMEIIKDENEPIRPLIVKMARAESKSFYEERRQEEAEQLVAHRAEVDRYWREQYELHADVIPYTDPAEMEDPS